MSTYIGEKTTIPSSMLVKAEGNDVNVPETTSLGKML